MKRCNHVNTTHTLRRLTDEQRLSEEAEAQLRIGLTAGDYQLASRGIDLHNVDLTGLTVQSALAQLDASVTVGAVLATLRSGVERHDERTVA
jgi:hypothetical protein